MSLSLETIEFAQREQINWKKQFGKDDPSLEVIITALETVELWLKGEWPLSEEKLKQLNIGVYAVRNLIPDFTELAGKVNDLEFFLENPTKTEIPMLQK